MSGNENLPAARPSLRMTAVIVLVWIAAAGAAIVIPWWQHFVAPWRVEIVRVGARSITMTAMVARLRPVLANMQPGTDPLASAIAVVHGQRDELLILEEAGRRKILPTKSDIDREIRARIGTTNAGQDDTEARLGALVRGLGIGISDYRATVRAELARKQLGRALAGDADVAAPHVLLAAVLLERREDAEQVAAAAQSHGNLAELATRAKLPVAEMDWTPRGVDNSLVRAADQPLLLIDDIAFGMAAGEISPPLQAEEGFLVIQVLGKAQRKPSATDQKTLIESALSGWLVAEIKRRSDIGDVTWRWTSDHHRFASQQIQGTR